MVNWRMKKMERKTTNDLTDRKRSLIFINILIVCIATSLLSTSMTTALLPVTTSLGVSINMGQWLTSGYSLAMGIVMPLTAFLIKRFPSRKLYITGIVIFIIGLIISASATVFPVMMVGRIFQACGNGVLLSMAQVVLLTIYPDEKKGTIMGWYGLSVSAAPVIAPTIAGILVDAIGWRSIFIVDIVVMTIALIFAYSVFDDVIETRESKFDFVSFIISGFAFGGITLGIGNIGGFGLFHIAAWLPLMIGIAAGIIFVYQQIHLASPFLDMKILKSRAYALSVIGSVLLYFVMMGSSVIMPLYVQSIMGYSATISGLVTLPGSLVMAIVSPMAGKIYDKLGMKKLFVSGAMLLLISNLGMYFISMHTSIIIPTALNVIRCIAIGCLMMPLVTWGTMHVEKEKVPDATALLTSLRTVGGAIGAAVFVGIMTNVGEASAQQYGEAAAIHGLNITFLCMSAGALVLLAIAVFCVQDRKRMERTKTAC